MADVVRRSCGHEERYSVPKGLDGKQFMEWTNHHRGLPCSNCQREQTSEDGKKGNMKGHIPGT